MSSNGLIFIVKVCVNKINFECEILCWMVELMYWMSE